MTRFSVRLWSFRDLYYYLGEDVDMSEDLDEWIVGSSDDATNTAVVQQPDSSDEHTYDLLHADVPQLPISDEVCH